MDDFFGVGEAAVALAAVDVSVEGIQGFQAEAGLDYLVNAAHGAGFGLFLGDGDFPELGYLVGDGVEDGAAIWRAYLRLRASIWLRSWLRVIFSFSGHIRSYPAIV